MFIVTKQIDSTNISRLCRTCLQEDCDKMVYLFVGPAGSSLAAKLRSLSCLDVWQGDGLPERMCDRCVTRTESALLYREQCRAADRALRQAAFKVANISTYSTVTNCKLFEENQKPNSIETNQPTFKCMECGATFLNNQELWTHKKIHLTFYKDNNMPLHVFESHMGYSNYQNHPININIHQNQSPVITPLSNTIQSNSTTDYPLLDYSLSNKIPQTTTHNYTDVSDEEHIDISDSNMFARDEGEQTRDNLIQDLSYSRTNAQYQVIDNFCPTEIPIEETTKSITNEMSTKLTVPAVKNQIAVKKFQCEQCSKCFSQKSKLRSHVLTHSELKPFQCSYCHKNYTLKSKLNAHIRLHTKRNVHRCRICDKEFSYPSYLKEHEKVHELKPDKLDLSKNFECPVCRKGFRVEKNLKIHMRLHSEDATNILSCELCNKKFSRKYHLKTHLKMHQTVSAKTHKCQYCDKCFSHKCNLVEHLRIHTKMKPFRCDSCGKCFAQSSHLKSHKICHENVRLHQCTVCGKGFKLLSHLKRHENVHTGGNVYKCNDCGQLFSHSFSLKRHLKKHTEL